MKRVKRFGLVFCLGLSAVGAFSIASTAFANNISWFISSSDPFLQNWSIASMIVSDDDWNNVMSINGYRGDDLTTGTGTNPQSVLTDGAATPLDVIADQSNPNTLTTGGVAEFDGISNPTIALQGSGTADAPHIVIRLNKESCPDTKFITISYKVRDIDGSADDAVQAVALHYRVGDTGNYINVPEAFIADATDAGTAFKETNVFATLPHIPVSQNLIFLRILTTNAAGNDEWVGLDDISIGCFQPTAAVVSVAGRVFRGKEAGVARAAVTMTDETGKILTARTNAFGYYRFAEVEAGKTYTFDIRAKGLEGTTEVVTIQDNTENLDFHLQ